MGLVKQINSRELALEVLHRRISKLPKVSLQSSLATELRPVGKRDMHRILVIRITFQGSSNCGNNKKTKMARRG